MRILKPYYRINHVSGISIFLQKDGGININVCQVTAKIKQLDIEKKILNIKSIEALKGYIQLKSVIALNLTGKGVLTKQLEKTEDINQGNFNKVFPDGNVNDFYIQNFISGAHSFISVIRKTEADGWIMKLKELGYLPLSLSLGPFPVNNVLPQLNIYGEDIQFNRHVIGRDHTLNWISYKFEEDALTPFTLKIETENINEALIIPYAVSFQLILAESLDVIQANVTALSEVFKNRLSNNKLKVNSIMLLTIIFVLLLVNFIVFSWLNSSNAKLDLQVNTLAQSSSDISNITGQIKKKEGLLKELGWDGGINKSNLVDQLAALMPTEITLKEITINPLDLNRSRTQKTLKFDRKIDVIGTCDKIISVNEWMERIKAQKWVKNIQLENYAFNNIVNTGQFDITIEY